MNAQAVTYSPIFFLMKEHLEQLNLPLRMEFNGLIAEIKSILHSDVLNLNNSIEGLLPQIFNIRIKSIKWIIEEEGQLDIKNLYYEINEVIAPLTSDPKYGILAENCSFAIRTNQRVFNSILANIGSKEIDNGIHGITQTEIEYSQLISALKSSLPFGNDLNNLINWIDVSLRIEIVLFSLIIIDEYQLNIQDQIVNRLSEIIANDAQQYYAMAKIFGLITTKKQVANEEEYPESFLSEQHDLSELGFDEFINSID
jgi:hypothetical protein